MKLPFVFFPEKGKNKKKIIHVILQSSSLSSYLLCDPYHLWTKIRHGIIAFCNFSVLSFFNSSVYRKRGNLIVRKMAKLFMKKASTAELETFYPIRPECQEDVPKTRFKLRAGKTLSARRWKAAFSQDGRLDIASVLRRIQQGGVHPSIKGVVWEFLLGCYDPNSTFEERNFLRQRRREQYRTWKAECQQMVPIIGSGKFVTTPIVANDGKLMEESKNDSMRDNGSMPTSSLNSDKKVIQWKLSLHQIGLDVVRTDRALVFYESEANQAKLWDVLSVYAWLDNDIGYVQGMNDICSPMVILLDDEADAFWCFERAMRRLRENFRCSSTSIGVQAQLCTLSQIIKAIDPKLHQHLGTHSCS